MRALHDVRRWLNNLPYTDPIQGRLAPVLQLFFISLIGAILLAVVLALVLIGPSWATPASVAPVLVLGLALAVGLHWLRQGYFNRALALIIIALILNQARGLLASGFLENQQSLLTTVLPLTLAALLLGRRALILTSLVNFIIIAFIALQEQAAILAVDPAADPPTDLRLTGFALVIGLFVILIDLFGTAFRDALAASTQRQEELETEISFRKRAEQSLAEQREQYRVTLSSIGDAVIATNTGGEVMFINEVASGLTGWPAHEALGKELSQVFPIINEHTLEPVENPLKRVLTEGVVVGLANHTVLVRRDGFRQPIADSGAPIRDAAGDVIGAVLVFRDVTEERQAEERLKESEERFRVMADNAPVLIWMAGADKHRYYFNKQWLLFTGRSLDQEIGQGWADGLHPDDYEQFMETYSKAFNHHQPFSMEYRLRRHDGEYRWLIVNGDPRFDADGTFIGYIGSCTDIHERREAEDRARLLQTLTEALSSALTIEEVAQVVVEQGFAMLGAHLGAVALLTDEEPEVEIVGRHNVPDALMTPYQPLRLDAATPLTDSIRESAPVWIENLADYRRRYPDLADHSAAVSTLTQSIACLPMIVHRHVLGAVTISFRQPQRWDETRRAFLMALAGQCAQAMERAQLHHQAQLAAALEERQRLARELHDAVSQTLFSATIIAESLPAMTEKNPARAAEQLAQMVTLNRAAMSEMRTLLLELRPESILKSSLSALLQQLVEAAKGRKNIRAELHVEGGEDALPPSVHIALYRIAQESINNILKHSEARAFSVRLYTQPDQAHLEVSDNGRGFDTAGLSAGLGLDNIRERAEAIGAALDLRSELDKGTHVSVRWHV